MYKKFKTDRSTINYSSYCLVRSEYTIANHKAYNIYLNNVRNKFKIDPKSSYRFVNSKRRAADFSSVMKLGCHKSSDNEVISNLFAEFFLLLPVYDLHLILIIKIIFLNKRLLMCLLLIDVLFLSI